jgi:hypothetical protein
MDFQQVDINSLIAYPENARTHDEKQIKQIAKSIKKFGFCAPCLVDDDGVLIAGHGRLMAAQTLGLETIPVVRINHLTPEQVKAYRIADNQLALNAHWDVGLLSLELGNLKDAGFDLDLLGFDNDLVGKAAHLFLEEVETQGNVTEPDSNNDMPVMEGSVGHDGEFVTLTFSFTKEDRDLVVEKLRVFSSKHNIGTVNQALIYLVKDIEK